MRFRIIALTVVAAALGVSVATAAPMKGKPDKQAPATCRMHTVELGGLVAGTADSSFTMSVKRANHLGRAFKGGSATVNVDSSTKMKRDGKAAKLADLVVGDRVMVQARACRADLKGGATPALLARKVIARSAKAPEPSEPSK